MKDTYNYPVVPDDVQPEFILWTLFLNDLTHQGYSLLDLLSGTLLRGCYMLWSIEAVRQLSSLSLSLSLSLSVCYGGLLLLLCMSGQSV